jgi:hypothetical protein
MSKNHKRKHKRKTVIFSPEQAAIIDRELDDSGVGFAETTRRLWKHHLMARGISLPDNLPRRGANFRKPQVKDSQS